MAGELEIKGLEELIKQVNKLKTDLGEIVTVIAGDIKATEAKSKADLNAAKTLAILDKNTREQAKAEEQSALNKLKAEKVTNQLISATEKLSKEQKLLKTITESEVGSYVQLNAQYQLNLSRLKEMGEEKRKNTKAGKELEQQTAELNQKLKDLDKTVGVSNRNVGDYEIATKSARQEIKELTAVIIQAKLAQNENTDEVKQAKQRLGELKDAMADTAMEAKILGSDTQKLDMAVGVFRGIGSAAQVAEGSMQLFGAESEDVQKGIQRMVAMQGVLNGVQEIGNALQKESAFMMGVNAAKTKVASMAQSVYTAVVGASSGALKAFKAAMLATGIGAIIVGIGLLVANWDKLKSAIMGTDLALEKYNKTSEKGKKENEIKNAFLEKEIALMKAKGATEEQIAAKTKQILENNASQAQKEFDGLQSIIDKKKESLEFEKNNLKETRALNMQSTAASETQIQKRINRLNEEILINENSLASKKNVLAKENEALLLFNEEQKTILNNKADKSIEIQNRINNETGRLLNELAEKELNNAKFKLDQYNITNEELNKSIEEYNERKAENEIALFDEAETRLTEHLANQLIAAQGNNELTEIAYQEFNAAMEFLQLERDRKELDNMYLKDSLTEEEQKRMFELKKSIAQQELSLVEATNDAITKSNAKRTATEIAAIQAKAKAKMMELDMLEGISETVGALAKKDSALAIAAFAVQKAIMIARVWVATAASNAIITAEAGAAAIPTLGGSVLAGISLIAANNIMAGIQTALIAAQSVQELDLFAKGTKDAPGGPAILGDGTGYLAGSELVTLPDGTMFLTPNKPTFYPMLPEHSKVTPANLVDKELADISKSENIIYKNDNKAIYELIEVVKNKKEMNVSIDKYGFRTAAKEGLSITNILDSKYRC